MRKRKIERISLSLIVLLMIIFFGGCYNYRDINNVTFTTGVVFDVDPLGNVVIYMDCAKPYRDANQSSDKGKRIIYKGKGKTALEAIRDVNMASSYKVNFTQNRAIIFTENAAKKGIDTFLDLINNDQEFQAKPYAFVFFGDIEELLSVSFSDEEYLGVYLSELVQKNKANPRAVTININDYLDKSIMGNNYSLLGGLELRSDAIDKRVELSGGVLMKNDKMVQRINIEDGLSYNFLNDQIKTGTLEIVNPQMEKGFITLEILSSKTRTKIDYDGNRALITKKINIRTTVAESQGRFIISKEALYDLKLHEEKKIELILKEFFEKFNKKNIDMLGVERYMNMKYPNLVIENLLSKVDLNVEVNLDIEGTSLVKNNFF